VNNGDNLFFDCPPIHFNDADSKHIRGFSNSIHKNDYYVTVDQKGNKIRPNSPKIVPKIMNKYDPKIDKTIKVQDGLVEKLTPNNYKKNYCDYWMIMTKNMNESSKHNLMVSAFECGNRLERRDENILTAFTYGKKIRFKELDDKNYIENLLYDHRCRKKLSKNYINKKMRDHSNRSIDLTFGAKKQWT
jgi:hypothetical protein